MPQEEVPKYESKGKQFAKARADGSGIPGLNPTSSSSISGMLSSSISLRAPFLFVQSIYFFNMIFRVLNEISWQNKVHVFVIGTLTCVGRGNCL